MTTVDILIVKSQITNCRLPTGTSTRDVGACTKGARPLIIVSQLATTCIARALKFQMVEEGVCCTALVLVIVPLLIRVI